ncbi:hypothetical protein MQK_02799 [Staphylococcus aureus subsp. aureus VRS6]|nr:hypothetical protein MQK_02799 [Staphylococcus aureus subsp. aureus VRS6]
MEIEIKFNEVFNAPMGSPRPRFRNTGRFVQTSCQRLTQSIKRIYKGKCLS